jgi:hypothetical protein
VAGSHDDDAEASELGSSHRFGEEVTTYFISYTVFNCNGLALLHISNKEISHVCVPGPFGAQCSSICFKLLVAQVILMRLCLPERLSLIVEEVRHQHGDGHALMHSNQLGFSGACSVELMSFCQAIIHAFPKGCVCISMSSRIVMNNKCYVNESVILVKVCSLDCQAQELGSADVLGNFGYCLVVVFVCFVLSDLVDQE